MKQYYYIDSEVVRDGKTVDLVSTTVECRAENQRAFFQHYLRRMGYQIDQNCPAFDELFNLYFSSEWGEMVGTELMPVWAWKSRVAEKLLEPFKVMGRE